MGRNHNCLANVLDKIQQFIGRTCFPAIWEIDVWQAASRIGTFLMALLGGTQSSKATNIAASNWLHIWLISIEYFCLYTSLIESFVILENFWYIAIEVGCDSKREPTTKLSLGSSGKDLHHKSHHVQCKHEMKNLLILKSSPHSFEVLNVVFLSPTSACKPLSSCSFPAIFGTTSKVHPTGPLIHTALAQSQAHTRSQIQLSQTAQGSSHMPWDVAKNDRNDVCSSESMFNPLGVVDVHVKSWVIFVAYAGHTIHIHTWISCKQQLYDDELAAKSSNRFCLSWNGFLTLLRWARPMLNHAISTASRLFLPTLAYTWQIMSTGPTSGQVNALGPPRSL